MRPKRSRRSALHLLNQVYEFNRALGGVTESELVEPAESGLSHALGQIRKIMRPGSTLYVISDFVTLDERAVQYLNQLSQHNNVVCCLVYDALEESLPTPGLYSITDGRRKGALNTFNRRGESPLPGTVRRKNAVNRIRTRPAAGCPVEISHQ